MAQEAVDTYLQMHFYHQPCWLMLTALVSFQDTHQFCFRLGLFESLGLEAVEEIRVLGHVLGRRQSADLFVNVYDLRSVASTRRRRRCCRRQRVRRRLLLGRRFVVIVVVTLELGGQSL